MTEAEILRDYSGDPNNTSLEITDDEGEERETAGLTSSYLADLSHCVKSGVKSALEEQPEPSARILERILALCQQQSTPEV